MQAVPGAMSKKTLNTLGMSTASSVCRVSKASQTEQLLGLYLLQALCMGGPRDRTLVKVFGMCVSGTPDSRRLLIPFLSGKVNVKAFRFLSRVARSPGHRRELRG